MEVLFLVDNIMAMRMFAPIIRTLPQNWECLFVNFDGYTEQGRAKVDDYAYELGVKCKQLKKHNKQSVGEMIDEEKPSVIVFAREESTPAESIFVGMSCERGIPTLFVPHGVLMAELAMMNLGKLGGKTFRIRHLLWLANQAYKRWRGGKISISRLIQIGLFRIRNDFQESDAQSRYDRYTKIATYGETMKEILLSRHVKPESIVITGSTKFDSYAKQSVRAEGQSILLFTEYPVEFGIWTVKQRAEYVLAICRLITLAPYTKLVIKIHPMIEEKNDYAKIVSHLICPPRIYQDEALPKLINECYLAMAITSSAGLEVMASGKPLVIYNPYEDETIYKESSGAYFAYNEDELRKVVGKLFKEGMDKEHKEMAEKFVYNHTYKQDGRAGERIATLIVEMGG